MKNVNKDVRKMIANYKINNRRLNTLSIFNRHLAYQINKNLDEII